MHFGSGQLVRIARTGWVPLTHLGSVHSADTRTGPPLNEQELSTAAAASTAPAVNRQSCVLLIPVRRSSPFTRTGTRWNAMRASTL